nr:response regulator [Planctomycetota bacterium]
AAEAPEAVLGERPDLVILDLALPDRPAAELFRELRERHPHLPVLLVGGHDCDHAARRCFDLNPAGLLARPIDTRELARLAAAAVASDPDRELVVLPRLGNEWFDLAVSAAPAAVLLLARYLQALGRQPLPAAVLDDVVRCIRELATNGFALAEGPVPDLAVRISTMFLADRVLIRVADERGGFAVRRLFSTRGSMRGAGPERAGAGHAAATVEDLMTTVRSSRSGETILLVKSFPT